MLKGEPASNADYERLPFARAFIDETLRLYPPAPFLGREAIVDDELGGREVKAGTQVIISPWIVHRHRAIWHEPELFAPDRFSPEMRERIPRGAFIPFGLGPRICIGQTFAMQEILTVLSILVPRYRFELIDPSSVEAQSRITLQRAARREGAGWCGARPAPPRPHRALRGGRWRRPGVTAKCPGSRTSTSRPPSSRLRTRLTSPSPFVLSCFAIDGSGF